jgi:hypothetical protein
MSLSSMPTRIGLKTGFETKTKPSLPFGPRVSARSVWADAKRLISFSFAVFVRATASRGTRGAGAPHREE